MLLSESDEVLARDRLEPYLRPVVYSRQALLGLSQEHRPPSTEWDEILAKDKLRSATLCFPKGCCQYDFHPQVTTCI